MLAERDNESPADYYLEGSDQHRGWFQSSLLTKIAVSKKYPAVAPFKTVITHGFVLDAKGQKMSKSLKNVVTPDELINGRSKKDRLGIDGMRLWISQSDYTSDISLSPVIINQVGSLLKKLRVSYKFLLGNLESVLHEPSYEQLRAVDKKVLSGLYQLSKDISQDYESLAFNRVVKRIQGHLSVDLSAFYFDIVKDRLYADAKDSVERRSIQYVLAQVLKVYVTCLSPITPLLSQEVWESSPDYIRQGHDSPFKAGWFNVPEEWHNADLEADFETLMKLRGLVNNVMEEGRGDKNVRSSLGSSVFLTVDDSSSLYEKLQEYRPFLEELFITSSVQLNSPIPDNLEWSYQSTATIADSDITVTVGPPALHKCPRCWQFTSEHESELCHRCEDVLHPTGH
ncbi:isoleucine--tRNA ligase ISM1 [Sugiyamaella lignohabitans]|uniref:Isoleucine--tRNA ligase ISM1 n=1 Tax=Sugiyamaella lignohabitans TaxID=796027 RepID=A0A161HF62_9ASCO|nr:isoleucine--tRNA ligase ISM1 [Sugiyamaella lignohabitans]ANB14100.1 isoleucine--tRNA ligase ISM1 [Sugiyamaella lignohabitans]